MAKRRQPDRKADKSTRERKPRTEKPSRAAKGPRSQALPGMEQPKHVYLDHRAARVNEIRSAKNELITEETDELRRTLKYMHDNNVKAYRKHGVTFERIEGEEKLVCRTSKEKATEMLPPSDAGGPAPPDDQGSEGGSLAP